MGGVGKVLGGFEILAKVGEGGMGAVFKARQASVGRVVALKVLPPLLARDKKTVERFLREARAAAMLKHPNLLQVFDAGVADGSYYYAMEFVDGQSVRKLLDAARYLPEQRALEIARDVASALDCAHSAGLVHRDVKPANILIASDGSVKLADLGLARKTAATDAAVTQPGVVLGTPNYIAPEQIRGEEKLDGRCDVYSLGATLYHMLAGAPPFSGRVPGEVMAKHLTEPVPDPRRLNPHISPQASRIVQKAMAKEREHRYTNAKALVHEINSLLGAVDSAEPSVAALPPGRTITSKAATRWAHRLRTQGKGFPVGRLIGTVAAVLLLVAAVVLGIRSLNRRSDAEAQIAKERGLLADARKWVGENPGQYDEALKKYAAIREEVTDPRFRNKIGDDVAELTRARIDAAQEAFDQITKKAGQLKAAGKYDDAIAAYSKVPPQYAEMLRPKASKAASELKEEAESRINTACSGARASLEKEQFAAALDLLDEIKDVQYRALTAEVQALRKTAGEALDKLQGPSIAQLLDAIDAAVANGDLAGPKKLAEIAAFDRRLRPSMALIETIAGVADALPRMGPQGAGDPRTPHECIAAAMLALAAKDQAKVEAALRTAGQHPLAARYDGKLRTLKESAAAAQAEEAALERLAAHRKKVAAQLTARRYDKLAGELDEMLAGAEPPVPRDEVIADRRLVQKLMEFKAQVLAVVRANIGNASYCRGVSARITGVDGEVVKFDIGKTEALTEMRGVDIKRLLDLDPKVKAKCDEGLALLLIAGGQAEEARTHAEKVADKTDIERLQQMMEESRPRPEAPAEGTAEPPNEGETGLRALIDKNEQLYKESLDEAMKPFQAARDKLKETWDQCNAEIAGLEDLVLSSRHEEAIKSAVIRPKESPELSDAKEQRIKLAANTRDAMASISIAESRKKVQMQVVLDRHKRQLLRGTALTEEQMRAAFEEEVKKQ